MLGTYTGVSSNRSSSDIRLAGLWKPERVLDSPQRPEARLHGGADVLVLCANNYLGLADDPRVIAAARAALRPLGLRNGVGAIHLRHSGTAQGTRTRTQQFSRNRRHHSLFVVLRRQWRLVRNAAWRRGCRDFRRTESRVDHRWHPAVEGPALSLQESRHGGS